MVTEDLEDAIHFGVVVVEMRRETQHPLARRGDDAVLFEVTVPLQQRALYAGWKRTDDGRADRTWSGHAPAERVEPIRHPRRHPDRLGADRLDSDFQQQLDRCAEAVDAVLVERTSLPAARVRPQIERRLDEFSAALDIGPAALEDIEKLAMLLRHVEERRTFRPAHPFVSVGGKKGDLRFTHIDRQDADALDGVDAEKHMALRTERADRVEIGGESVVKGDRGDGDDSRVTFDEPI